MPAPELADEVRKRFLRVGQAMRRDASGLAVTTAQGAALSLLRGGPLTVGELARAEGIRPPTMTQIVNRMEQAGWVARRDGAGRGHRVRITAAGRAVAEQVRRQRNALLAARLADLSPGDLNTLERALPVLDRLFGPPVVDRSEEADRTDETRPTDESHRTDEGDRA